MVPYYSNYRLLIFFLDETNERCDLVNQRFDTISKLLVHSWFLRKLNKFISADELETYTYNTTDKYLE